MVVRRGSLHRTAGYADGVGLHKDLGPRRGPTATAFGAPGKAVAQGDGPGLEVLVWTLRSENRYLPASAHGCPGTRPGDAATGWRGSSTSGSTVDPDFPDVAVRVRT